MAKVLSKKMVRQWLGVRKPKTHKGSYGHTLILAGSRGMVGAGVLSSIGALRGGSGLVTLGTPRSVEPIASRKVPPECMTFGLPETSKATLSPKALSTVLKLIHRRKITALVIGPGCSRDLQTQNFVKKLLQRLSNKPCSVKGIVLDADGFVSLSNHSFQSPNLSKLKIPCIVTPHPGEFSKFTGKKVGSTELDKRQSAKKFAKLNRIICVLKGYRSVITDGKVVWINPTGNPGMATGGSGDVLSGLIGAFVSQRSLSSNEEVLKAAAIGVFVHGLAGDFAKKKYTEFSMVASDIGMQLHSALKIILGK